MKCEQEMRADCKGDIMNKSRNSEWSFVHWQPPAQSIAKYHFSGMPTCSGLTSGSEEPPSDLSHAPLEAHVPSQLGRHVAPSPPFLLWKNMLALLPSQRVRKSLGSSSIGSKGRKSRGQRTLAEMWPKAISGSQMHSFKTFPPGLNAQVPHSQDSSPQRSSG